MTSFPHAHATADNWLDLCARILEQLEPSRRAGSLGFVYVSDALDGDLAQIVRWLRSNTGTPHWVGTVGMGICSTGLETYDTPAMAVMITDFREDQLRIMPAATDSCDGFLAATRDWRTMNPAAFAVVHGDPSSARTPELIGELADGLDNGFLVGGLTSSRGEQLQVADGVTSGALSGVLLSADVPVVTGLTQGCSLIGAPHTITACQDNVIVSIDDRPALDVFREDIGETLSRNLNAVAGYIFVALPIRGSDTGDYLVRNLLGIDPGQGLLAIGDRVSSGNAIQFAKRDPRTAREDLSRMVRSLRRRLPGEPRGALYHSCLGRGRHQFGEDSAELKLVREELGDVPLVGFYANGEISHRRLYGYTGVLTVFC